MVSDESIARAEKRLGMLPVAGRFHRSPRALQDDYSLEDQVLGRGCSGKVLLGTCRRSAARVAVKSLSLAGLAEAKRQELENELELFLSMDHPRIARLLDVYESDDRLSFVMECMEGGELFKRVLDREVFTESQAAEAARQMLLALNYIHSHGIVHRDIKLENFMYVRKETDHLKLIDFGLSKAWDPDTRMKASCGTLGYIGPEVLDRSYVGSQCDLWSLGVIVYILLSGCMPFTGSESHQVVCIMSGMYDMDGEEWASVSETAKDFLNKLLVVDPTKRLTAQQALDHAFISQSEKQPSAVDKSVIDALRKFENCSKFRRACLSAMAWSLTHEERKSVAESFAELDTSKRGTIRLWELRDVLKARFGTPDEEVEKIFHALNSSHDDEVHYTEFLAAMVSSRIAMHEHLLRAAFDRLDVDGSGFITKENLAQLFGDSFDGAAVDELIAEVDQSQTGKVAYDDFVAYLRSGHAQEAHIDAANQVIDVELTAPDETGCQAAKRRKVDTSKVPKAVKSES